MKNYRIFVQFSDDAFGKVRELTFPCDDAALRFAREQILREHPGCDVWGDGGRVALLSARDAFPAGLTR